MPAKRRRKTQQPAPLPAPTQPPMWRWWLIGGAVVLAIVAGVLTILVINSSASPVASPTPLRQPGPANACRSVPTFATAAGYAAVNFATDDRAVMGLKMFDPAQPEQEFRHPSWAQAGFLGPLVADGLGNLYVAPVPRINLIDNPPPLQNRIYKVDTTTAEMQLFLELPSVAPAPTENPYGVLGLAIDCETNSLYVTSVAGSDRNRELGRIYRINLTNGQIAAQYDGIDAIGIGVYNTARGKRLYFGPTRVSEVRSIALDAQGNFVGSERVEFALQAPGASGSDRARRINFTDQNEMLVNGRQFDYNLIANTVQPNLLYVYRYRTIDDGWDFVSFDPN
jgi:hypothetical protein